MAENTIEIEVELVGQKKALEGLGSVKEGAEGIGESFKGVGELVGKTNKQLGESLGSVSDAVGSSVEAFGDMKEAIKGVSAGGMSLLGMVGVLGGVVGAVAVVYEAFLQVTGIAKELEDREQAMAAAAADLESKLESLAEGGVTLAGKELKTLMKSILDSQVAKERLEKKIERLNKVYFKHRDALEAVEKAEKKHNQELKDASHNYAGLNAAVEALNRAKRAEIATDKALSKQLAIIQKQQEALSVELAKAAKLEEAASRNTYDQVKAKAGELIGRQKALDLMRAEMESKNEEIKQLQILMAAEDERALRTKVKLADDQQDLATLKQVRDALEAKIKATEKEIEATYAQFKADEISDRAAKKRAADRQARAAKRKSEQMAQMALENQRVQQASQLAQLEIKLTKEGDDQLMELAHLRFETGLSLARDNATARAIVEKQYQLEVEQIRKNADARERDRLAKIAQAERDALDKRLELTFEIDTLKAEAITDETERELALLNARYAQEFALARDNQERISHLTKAYGIERLNLESKQAQAQAKIAEDLIDQYGKGFAEAAANAILFGDSFKEASAEVLKGLAVEATTSALMETAKAAAVSFINPALSASHLKAAAIFAAVAGAAKTGASALGASFSGGGATAGANASPSGAPQTAPTAQREQAESREMTFNVNFGGAVIYDTKEAAKRAMLSDLVQSYNRPTRGMPRFNLGR